MMQKIFFTLILFIILSVGRVTTSTQNAPQSPTTDPTPVGKSNQPTTEVQLTTEVQPTQPVASVSAKPKYKVVSVTDGDTFKVMIDGKTETVRIVGINSPETVDLRKSLECFGIEASNKLKSLLENQEVQLETDSTQSDRDKYDRLLRFVVVNNEDIGLKMIQEGYAYEALYTSTPHRLHDAYVRAQKTAEKEKKGLWAEGVCPVLTPKPLATNTPLPETSSNKESCTGPDLDCSDFTSHAAAQQFFEQCGWSAENDPMRLDSVGIGDGVACENLP